MCGIGGIIYFNDQRVHKNDLKCLTSFMHERGPDAEGYFVDDSFGIANTRLKIIDIHDRANQPMFSHNQSIGIVFNGEIYNFRELRKELLRLGNSFNTESDTEVLLKGYIEWGMQTLLSRIEGMFAICIFDKRINKMFLIRDHFGQKPLYYFKNTNEIIFCSDIRAIRALKKNELTLDNESIDYYISEITVPQPKSIWIEIRQVKPSHFLEINLTSSAITENKYWSIDGNKSQFEGTLDDAVVMTEAKLTKSILKQAHSDVELGCFLSGGLDSGLVVSMLASHTDKPVNTFTLGLDFKELDESDYARKLAKKYSTNHTEIKLSADIVDLLPEIISFYGEPFADSSALPTYFISKEMKKHVNIGLSGDGGDELFGGYSTYLLAHKADNYLKKYPNASIRSCITLMSKIKSRLIPDGDNYGSIETFNSWTGCQKLYRDMGYLPPDKKRIYNPEYWNESIGYTETYLTDIWQKNPSKSTCSRLMISSLQTRLLNDYLVKLDRSSMKNSLEVRCPMLDKDLAEFSFSLPDSYKFHENKRKYILKRLAARYIDPAIFKRPKMGFSVPIEEWILNDKIDFVKDVLFSGSLAKRNMFNMDEIEKDFKKLDTEKIIYRDKIWALLCLELWFQQHVD